MYSTDSVTLNIKGPRWLQTLVGLLLIVVMGIWLHGLLLSVEYRWARVLDVDTVAGGDALDRMVLIDTPERRRVLRTSDILIRINKGGLVCVAKRRFVARHWLRYSVELPGYCRNAPRPVTERTLLRVD